MMNEQQKNSISDVIVSHKLLAVSDTQQKVLQTARCTAAFAAAKLDLRRRAGE